LKAASGGPEWNYVHALVGEGEKTSFGLTGKFRQIEDLATGHFLRQAEYEFFSNAGGMDESGRWRLDGSRQMHALDSEEAKTVARTDSYLAQRGYLFPEKVPATFRALAPETEAGTVFDRVEITPDGGRSVTLWIDHATHLLDRAVMQLSTVVETIRYSDYCNIDGLILPLKIVTSDGDWPDTGEVHVAHYRVLTSAQAAELASELARPKVTATGTRIVSGASTVKVPAHLDPMAGLLIVEAKINHQGPFPFILDTGGHAILTPDMAHQLGLHVAGHGFTNGAGAGSSETEYTKVEAVSLGDAELVDQPFVVLHLDLGDSMIQGKRMPVAGIIGAELFERFAVTIDYNADFLMLEPLDHFHYSGSGMTVPIRFTNDMPLVPAVLDGHAGIFGVDTGNNTNLIVFRCWAEANGLAARYETGKAMDSGTSVGGAVGFHMAHAQSFAMGGAHWGSIDILLAGDNAGSLSSRSEAGNLGGSVLSHFRVTFDYRREEMILEERPSPR
jgi:hypothetical protein